MVIKLPGDDFGFDIHRDNEFVQGNEEGKIHTVNLGVVLDDFTDLNGTIEVKGNNQEWSVTYPKKGDIIAINGNTPHCSSPNYSDNSRGLYACVYSEEQLNSYNFYSSIFSTIYDD
jgi:ectoine hydroxylase-related dioxygenase (phytanoyl-CoA dioxygenase family)